MQVEHQIGIWTERGGEGKEANTLDKAPHAVSHCESGQQGKRQAMTGQSMNIQNIPHQRAHPRARKAPVCLLFISFPPTPPAALLPPSFSPGSQAPSAARGAAAASLLQACPSPKGTRRCETSTSSKRRQPTQRLGHPTLDASHPAHREQGAGVVRQGTLSTKNDLQHPSNNPECSQQLALALLLLPPCCCVAHLGDGVQAVPLPKQSPRDCVLPVRDEPKREPPRPTHHLLPLREVAMLHHLRQAGSGRQASGAAGSWMEGDERGQRCPTRHLLSLREVTMLHHLRGAAAGR